MRRKLLFTTLFFVNLVTIHAQKNFSAVNAKPFNGISHHVAPSPNGACDTLNLDAASNEWSAYYYTYGSDGYVFGVSDISIFGITIQEDANYFDESASDYNYITGGLAYFAYANSTDETNLDKDVTFKVYEDNGGEPGTLLGSTTLKLSQIHEDVLNDDLTEFIFASPIQLPASKKFYVSIDHSNFSWGADERDSIAIVANGDNESEPAAYQYMFVSGLGYGWVPVDEFWGTTEDPLEVNLFIFPYMSNSPDGCMPLPVSILNFTGVIKNNQAYLSWSTATETNNKGFEIERSKDGQTYTSIGFVNGGGNSNQIKNYSYVDVTLKDIGVSTSYYRLKQVDMDGKATYSKVLPLSLKEILNWKLYPNPVKDKITVEINLNTASKVNVQVISKDGKIVLNLDKGILLEGNQVFSINTQHFARGSYIVRLSAGDKVFTQPIVKE